MQRALQLAGYGAGRTASNPMVGAVLVKDGRVVSEGYHKVFGGAHAEVEALYPLKEADCEGSILYVTLEPCNHHGKTPPCTELILEKKVPHVVLAMRDPNPLVAGKGVEHLRQNGVVVTEGLLEKEARELNKAFFKWMTTGMPYVILKWAQSADRYMGSGKIPDSTAGKISSEKTRTLVHRWRTECQAILTGRGTVESDNPKLTARLWPGHQPLRIILDSELKIGNDYHLLSDGGPTLILNTLFQGNKNNIRYLKPLNMELNTILERIGSLGISNLMVEAGPTLMGKIIQQDLWDEARVISSEQKLGNGIKAPEFSGTLKESMHIGRDLIQIYKRPE